MEHLHMCRVKLMRIALPKALGWMIGDLLSVLCSHLGPDWINIHLSSYEDRKHISTSLQQAHTHEWELGQLAIERAQQQLEEQEEETNERHEAGPSSKIGGQTSHWHPQQNHKRNEHPLTRQSILTGTKDYTTQALQCQSRSPHPISHSKAYCEICDEQPWSRLSDCNHYTCSDCLLACYTCASAICVQCMGSHVLHCSPDPYPDNSDDMSGLASRESTTTTDAVHYRDRKGYVATTPQHPHRSSYPISHSKTHCEICDEQP